jgi:hypothetical protein
MGRSNLVAGTSTIGGPRQDYKERPFREGHFFPHTAAHPARGPDEMTSEESETAAFSGEGVVR